MASSDRVNRRANGTKNLKVHFELPECEDCPNYHQQDSISSISSDSSLGSAATHEIAHTTIDSSTGLATQCPTTQMIGRTGYDPNRISSAIFSQKPTNPMEWSLASNESLFSLHIGNISFSKDDAFALNKSEELGRIEECMSMSAERNSASTDHTSEEITELVMKNIETSADTAMGSSEESGTSTIFHRLEESMVLYTNGSFQFPVLTVDGGRNSSAAVESEMWETEKPLGSHSPKSKTASNPVKRDWCHCFCFCSPCY